MDGCTAYMNNIMNVRRKKDNITLGNTLVQTFSGGI
jgi:hypothetical protein